MKLDKFTMTRQASNPALHADPVNNPIYNTINESGTFIKLLVILNNLLHSIIIAYLLVQAER
jgi:hypothetical protein